MLAGLRAGRSRLAGSASVALHLTATVGGRVAGVGDRLPSGGQPITVRVQVAGVPSGTISPRTERGVVRRELLSAKGSGGLEGLT